MTHRRTSLRVLAALAVTLCFALALPAVSAATPRDVVVSRGKVWVDKKVPYSQSTYATPSGTTPVQASQGFRQDCSGFVSMCYDFRRLDGTPLSLDTAGLPARFDKITKDTLAPGDIILRPKNQPGAAYGHAVVFVRWTDATRTHYVGIHQSSSAKGAVEAVIKYPFWNETGFEPYRYKEIADDFADCLVPFAGGSRFDTAVAASRAAYPATAPAVVIANGMNWPDALGGAALAGAVDGPILLTLPDRLVAETAREIQRLRPARVFVLGGEASVEPGVEEAIQKLGVETIRLGGRTRYDTAAAIADRVVVEAARTGRAIDGVYIASGLNFPDALAAAPVANARVRPILLTDTTSPSSASAQALGRIKPARAWVLGGEMSVDATVSAAVATRVGTVERLAARDRYQTSVVIARHGVASGLRWQNAAVASGVNFPDALAGGAAQGKRGSVLLLTDPARLPQGVASEVTARRGDIGMLGVYGGINTVTYPVRQNLADLLRTAQ